MLLISFLYEQCIWFSLESMKKIKLPKTHIVWKYQHELVSVYVCIFIFYISIYKQFHIIMQKIICNINSQSEKYSYSTSY